MMLGMGAIDCERLGRAVAAFFAPMLHGHLTPSITDALREDVREAVHGYGRARDLGERVRDALLRAGYAVVDGAEYARLTRKPQSPVLARRERERETLQELLVCARQQKAIPHRLLGDLEDLVERYGAG